MSIVGNNAAMSKALFISDCHLSENKPKTNRTFIDFCKNQASNASQLFILGDLFDYWIGDEMLCQAWAKEVCDALYKLKEKKIQTFFSHGNRDFLVGEIFFKKSGLRPLDEIVMLELQGKKIVILHGDILCKKDYLYLCFRHLIRSSLTRKIFETLPKILKTKIVQSIRFTSKKRGARLAKKNNLEKIDVDKETTIKLMDQFNAKIMIHGHTHIPGHHREGETERFVLSDWDLDSRKNRGNYLKLENGEITSITIK